MKRFSPLKRWMGYSFRVKVSTLLNKKKPQDYPEALLCKSSYNINHFDPFPTIITCSQFNLL